LARPYAALVPAFESQVNRVRVAEVDHGIRTARALARRGDFKDAYLALDAVKEHSGLEPAYGAALRGVREDEVRWNIGVALMASRNGDFEGAQAQLGALGAKGLLPEELAAAGIRVRAEAQYSSIKSLAEAVLKGDAAETQLVMDRYSRLTGYRFSCQPRTLIEERDLGRFLTALEDLRIKPRGGEVRTGWLDLDLVESLGNRFTNPAEVSAYLGEGFRSYALQLAGRSRPGFALYLLGCAEREGVEPDPAVTRRLLAALGEAFAFTIYLPPTVTAATHPGPLATAPRDMAKAILQRSVGAWIRISDAPLPPSLAGLVVSTRLANIKVADSTQSETRTVRYQSGWDQVPNPEYAAVAQQLRQAQQNLNQVAAQDAANQQLAQSAVNSGGLNAFGAALAGAGAGLSRAALNAAQQNVNDWNVRLQSTPPTVQNAVYADEPYEATTHTISYDASFSAAVEVGGSPYAAPVTWTSNYSYNTVEIVGNAAHNVPVQAATYVPMESVVQTLSDSLTRKLSDGPDELISRLVGATQDVLDRELQMARVSEEASEDARWGLLALWKNSGAAVDQDRAKGLEVAIRSSLGLNPSPGPAAPAPAPVVAAEPAPHPEAPPAAIAEPVAAAPVAQAPAAAPSAASQPAPAGTGQHGFLGVQLRDLTPELAARIGGNSGALVAGTSPGGPAEKAGLMSGDVITKLNGETIADMRQFAFAVKVLPPGTSITVEFFRDGQTSTTTVQLGVREGDDQAAPAGNAGRGFIGVELQDLTPELATRSGTGTGAAVVGTVPGGPADKAGLKGGDVITKVDGVAMADLHQFIATVRDLPPGKVVTVEYFRSGQSGTAEVTLGVRPTAAAESPGAGAFTPGSK
jgi:S1-C subfamily serine protease